MFIYCIRICACVQIKSMISYAQCVIHRLLIYLLGHAGGWVVVVVVVGGGGLY